MAFAGIAEHLYDAEDFDQVLSRIAAATVAMVAGCDTASVTIREHGGYRTAGSTDSTAQAVDEAQYASDEGPSLDAVDASMVYAEAFPDERWPKLGARPREAGVQSALSYGLRTRRGDIGAAAASLNSYGAVPSAFDDEAQEIGLILAAHASVAARAVEERSRLEMLGANLQQALLSRDVIGQAKGILMERFQMTPEDAFEVLRQASQRLNAKVHQLARGIAETGQLPAIPQRHTAHPPTKRWASNSHP